MKKITALIMALGMTFVLAACGGGSAPASSSATPAGNPASATAGKYDHLKSVEIIGADSTGKGAAGQIFGELVAAKLDTITGGKLTMSYHPNGELGGDADILRQMQAGDIAVVVCQTAPVVSFIPEMAVFDLPMVFSKYDGDTINKVLNSSDSAFRKEISAAYNKANFELLGFLQNATYRLTTANVALNDLASFKALQIRTMENPNHMGFWTAIGAEPTPLAWAEVYFALQSGTIDAQENAADTCVGANLNEVQKYLACTNHILYANQIAISSKVFNDLDPLYQEALRQAVTEALEEMRPQLSKIDVDNKAILASKGMTVIEYDAAFYDGILNLDAVKALYATIDAKIGGLGTTLQTALANA